MSEVRKTVNSLYGYPVEDTEARQKATENAEAIVELSEEIGKVNGGGLVKVAVFKGDQYDATVASLAAGASRPTTVPDSAFDCINMTHAEALAHIQSGRALTALILTNQNSSLHPQTLHATVRYAGSINLPDLIEVCAYDDASNHVLSYWTCLRWTADGIAYAFTQTHKEPMDDVFEWA